MLAGTFRDPTGSLFDVQDRILRLVRPAEAAGFEALLADTVVGRLVESGAIVATRRIDPSDLPAQLSSLEGVWYGHDRISFVSVPAEWSAGMLARAALHTLDINEELIRHGFILKDATPSNVLFEGTKPVFVDVPSIEPLVPGRDVWLARHQFETTFLLPLIANLDAGVPFKWSLSDPAGGISHEQLAQMLGMRRWIGLNRIRHIALPAALSGAGQARAGSSPTVTQGTTNRAKTQYILERSMAALRRSVLQLSSRINQRHSIWSAYETTRDHYSDTDLVQKREFVRRVLDAARADWVLDVGANKGEFSEMAAARASVVAIDLDEVSVSAIYGRARASDKAIQPLVVNIAQPTPAVGWKYGERKSFLARAQGRFDLALMLAVVHHLRVSAGVPLAEIVDLGLALGQGSLLIEYVPPDDPMFLAIARGREAIYTDYSLQNCRTLLDARVGIKMEETLANGRVLFWAARS